MLLKIMLLFLKLIALLKCNGFFSRKKFLLLLKNIRNFKVEPKYGYVEECMILNYIKPKVGREKSRSL